MHPQRANIPLQGLDRRALTVGAISGPHSKPGALLWRLFTSRGFTWSAKSIQGKQTSPHYPVEAVNMHTHGGPTTCNVVTASLPELLQSSNNNTSSSQVWSKLPDMPYSSHSINHYQGHLITFTGGHKVELPDEDKPVWELVPLIHIYNPDTKTWDCVGDIPHGYLLCKSVHIRENKILFIGGLTGIHNIGKDDDLMTICLTLTITPQ